MTNEEMKKWFLNKFEESIDECQDNDGFIDNETENLENALKTNFKFNDADKKYLKKEYSDFEISQAEKQTQKLMEQMAWNDWKNSHLNASKTTFDFTTIDWKNLDEYDMVDMKKYLDLNKREAEVLSSLWTLHNEHYHIGKNPDGSTRMIMISDFTHYLSLKSLRSSIELVEKFPEYERFSESLLVEAHKVLNDEEYTNKYDLDYIDKQKGISKRVKNATKKIKDLKTGIVYDSATECAEAIGKSSSFVSKHKERFETIK